MKAITNTLNQDFIEIPLYESNKRLLTVSTTWMKGLLFLFMSISILCFTITIAPVFLIIGFTIFVTTAVLLYRYYDQLFPTSYETLVIAYGAIHLMDKQKIKWYQSIHDCEFQALPQGNIKIATIKIFDKKDFTITIQHHATIALNANNSSSHYIIHSKSDWKKLKTSLSID